MRQGLLDCPPDNLVQLHQESLEFQKETAAALKTLQFQCQAVQKDISDVRSLQWFLNIFWGDFDGLECLAPA